MTMEITPKGSPNQRSVETENVEQAQAAQLQEATAHIGDVLRECRLLKKGAKGPETEAQTEQVQAMLVEVGFLAEGAFKPGQFNEATAAAVKQFQSAFQIRVDGEVGQQTWAAMYLMSFGLEPGMEIPLPPGKKMLKGEGSVERWNTGEGAQPNRQQVSKESSGDAEPAAALSNFETQASEKGLLETGVAALAPAAAAVLGVNLLDGSQATVGPDGKPVAGLAGDQELAAGAKDAQQKSSVQEMRGVLGHGAQLAHGAAMDGAWKVGKALKAKADARANAREERAKAQTAAQGEPPAKTSAPVEGEKGKASTTPRGGGATTSATAPDAAAGKPPTTHSPALARQIEGATAQLKAAEEGVAKAQTKLDQHSTPAQSLSKREKIEFDLRKESAALELKEAKKKLVDAKARLEIVGQIKIEPGGAVNGNPSLKSSAAKIKDLENVEKALEKARKSGSLSELEAASKEFGKQVGTAQAEYDKLTNPSGRTVQSATGPAAHSATVSSSPTEHAAGAQGQQKTLLGRLQEGAKRLRDGLIRGGLSVVKNTPQIPTSTTELVAGVTAAKSGLVTRLSETRATAQRLWTEKKNQLLSRSASPKPTDAPTVPADGGTPKPTVQQHLAEIKPAEIKPTTLTETVSEGIGKVAKVVEHAAPSKVGTFVLRSMGRLMSAVPILGIPVGAGFTLYDYYRATQIYQQDNLHPVQIGLASTTAMSSAVSMIPGFGIKGAVGAILSDYSQTFFEK